MVGHLLKQDEDALPLEPVSVAKAAIEVIFDIQQRYFFLSEYFIDQFDDSHPHHGNFIS